MMIFVNAFIPQRGTDVIPVSAMRRFLVLLNPFAPHLSSELWEKLSRWRLLPNRPWPSYDEKFLIEDEVEIVIQVNGKVRDRMMMLISALTGR